MLRKKKGLTPFQRHAARWGGCTECLLRKNRARVVLARGSIPCDVLFVGEAPGDSEDVVGVPFIGPAGRLLDHVIEQAGLGDHRLALTNLVCCVPKDSGNIKGEPPKDAILACRPRLEDFISICGPRLIICVGSLSQRWTPDDGTPMVGIIHPAAILRMDASQRPLAIKRCVVTVADAITTYQ